MLDISYISNQKDREMIQYIREYFVKNLTVPTLRQIAQELGYKSISSVWVHLDRLELLGYIKKTGKTYAVLGAKITFDGE